MPYIKKSVRTLLISLLVMLSACAVSQKTVSILPEGQAVAFPRFLASLGDEKIIFIGERHESKKDHRTQLEVIRHIHERDGNLTIALEMFSTGTQWALDEWVNGRMDEADFEDSHFEWKSAYGLYGPIFSYARKNKIPLVGINESESLIQDVARNGTAALSHEALAGMKFTPCSEDPVYAQMIEDTEKSSHKEPLPYLCDAQRIRDHIMAYYISRLAENREGTIIVLLGGVHAARPAVPRFLEMHGPYKYRVLMPGEYGHLLGRDTVEEDYIWN